MAMVFAPRNKLGFLLSSVMLSALGLLIAMPALAVDVPDSDLPPECQPPSQPGVPDCVTIQSFYSSDEELHALFPGPIDLTEAIHSCFTSCGVTHDGDEHETFDSKMTATIDIGAGPESVELEGPVEITTFGREEGELGTFDTEMVALELIGYVGGNSIVVSLDPLETSSGQVSISDNGNGTFDVDSFFDVHSQISINGGTPESQLDGPVRMTLQSTAPAPSLGVVGVVVAVAAMGMIAWMRRRAAAADLPV
jgi:hypothetical protein